MTKLTKMKRTDSQKNINIDLTWIMVSILAALALCYFFFEGMVQSVAVIIVLLVGLAAILVGALKK